jgi:hypothetical protein
MRRWGLLAGLLGIGLFVLLLAPAHLRAQTQPAPTLFPPGVVVTIILTPPAAATLPPGTCAAPLPFSVGDEIGIRGGVNLRNLPTISGAVVDYFELPVRAFVTEGPICADGFNWWRVRGLGAPAWVAEGTPGSYFLNLITDAENPEPCAPAQEIAVGERVRLLESVRVREDANEDALVITVAPAGSLLRVIGGARCSGGLNYWQVEAPFETTTTLIQGWITEGPDWGYYLEPETRPLFAPAECFPPLNLTPEQRVVVRSTGGIVRNLRAAPSERAPLVASLVGGVQLTVLAGPVCRDNFNWWQVQVFGGSDDPIGWVAEGTPQDRFITTLPQRQGPPY